jgi:hypothetical protein
MKKYLITIAAAVCLLLVGFPMFAKTQSDLSGVFGFTGLGYSYDENYVSKESGSRLRDVFATYGLTNYNFFNQKCYGFMEKMLFFSGHAFGCEVFAGPAAYRQLSDNLRLQIGAGFHFETTDYVYQKDSKDIDYERTSYHGLGIGADAQLKFSSNRRCSFIIGASASVDPFVAGRFRVEYYKYTSVETETDAKPLGYGFSPYVAFCFNFY